MAKANPRDKAKPHRILRPVRYHGEGEHAGALLAPGQAEVTFGHLDDASYLLLRRKGVIEPVETKKSAPAGATEGGE